MGHIDTAAMEPSLNEVQQVEVYEEHVIPVKVVAPAETRELPCKRIATRTVPVSTVAGVKLLSADPRRKYATIIPKDGDVLIGATQSQAQLSGAWIPSVVPFVVSSVSELWAIGDGADTDVSVIEEYFA